MIRHLIALAISFVVAFCVAWMLQVFQPVKRVYTNRQTGESDTRYALETTSTSPKVTTEISQSGFPLSVEIALNKKNDRVLDAVWDRHRFQSGDHNLSAAWKAAAHGYDDPAQVHKVAQTVDLEDFALLAQSQLPPNNFDADWSPLSHRSITEDMWMSLGILIIDAVQSGDRQTAIERLTWLSNFERLQWLSDSQCLYQWGISTDDYERVFSTYLGVIWACRKEPWALELIKEMRQPPPPEHEIRQVAAASWLRSVMFNGRHNLSSQIVFDVHERLLHGGEFDESYDDRSLKPMLTRPETILVAMDALNKLIEMSLKELTPHNPNEHIVGTSNVSQQEDRVLEELVSNRYGTEEEIWRFGINSEGPYWAYGKSRFGDNLAQPADLIQKQASTAPETLATP